MSNFIKTLLLSLCITFSSVSCLSQQKDRKILENEKGLVIEKMSTLLQKKYVFLDVAIEMSKYLQNRFKKGAYKSINSSIEFSKVLTKDLRSNFQDEHIGVVYSPKVAKRMRKTGPEVPVTEAQRKAQEDAIEQELKIEVYENFRFPSVKRLSGNIGYIKVDMFLPPTYARGYTEKMASIFEFVTDTDALIIDLSDCPGGYAEGATLFLSYLFPAKTHILTQTSRIDGKTETIKEYTLNTVSGKGYLSNPIYVLTSKSTGSAAEAVSHIIQYSGRGKTVGESTVGAGYAFDDYAIDNYFIMAVPYTSGKHPKAEKNWEGIGVAPNFPVSKRSSLGKAHLLAMEEVLKGEQKKSKKDQYEYKLKSLTWEIERVKGLNNIINLTSEQKESYVGMYEYRKIYIEKGQLFHQRNGNTAYPLICIGKDKFLLDGLEKYRVEFIRDKLDEIKKIKLYAIDRLDINNKNK